MMKLLLRELFKTRSLSPSLALLFLALLARDVGADFALTLSSSDNLNNLTVGQQITLQVSLSGLSTGDSLDELQTDITFLSSAFTISNISPGSIVPDPTGFSSGSGPSSSTGVYDDIFANSNLPITSNGLFFSVTAIASTAGSGSLTLANQSAFQGFNQITIADNTPGGGLDFNIFPAVSSVPAPGGMTLAASGTLFLLVIGSLRARRDIWLSSWRKWAHL